MGELRVKLIVSFLAKVLLPVIAVMALMMSVTVWVVDERIARQFETEGRRTLETAGAVFRNSLAIRSKNLLLRFRSLPNEPRYKATFQAQDASTLRELLKEMLGEHGVDVVAYAGKDEGFCISAKRDPSIRLSAFEAATVNAVEHALEGEEKSDTIRVGDRLYDVVSIPVSGVSGTLIGALTIGSEISEATAHEFSLLTHGHIALLAGDKVVASSVRIGTDETFAGLFKNLETDGDATNANPGLLKLVLENEHYFCSGGRFASLSGDDTLGYIVLSSYEQPLRALGQTRQTLLLASLGAIIGGALVVTLIIRKVTSPLRDLYHSVEAVGQGDFSRRVEVKSQDECGELAKVFNRMTENLGAARTQLEQTVETLRATQGQLVQSEKLSGIGEFVAGVAHELNNPLTSVMGFSELLRTGDTDPQRRRQLETIHKSAKRCHKIVQSLLSFARRHQLERKLISVNTIVEDAVEILGYQLRTSNIAVVTALDPKLPLAMVDPHQVQQVVLNIINNGRQAIEAHQSKGTIRVTTEPAGENVRITIQDNGPGIPEANLPKLFDPFFTTKEVGKGTGLGLSICYGLIKEHGGSITPLSRPGEGATFVIELPIAHELAVAETRKHETDANLPNPREGVGKKILVIDDEEPILQLMRDVLTRSGYEVDVAIDGEIGLTRVNESRYDALLCDWKMPGLSGLEVYERVQARNPAQAERFIFITGDVVNEKTRAFLEERKRPCLPKPFTLAEFRAALGNIVGKG